MADRIPIPMHISNAMVPLQKKEEYQDKQILKNRDILRQYSGQKQR